MFGFFILLSTYAFAQPNTIPGLSMWLKSDFGVTYNINNKVTAWNDASGNNNHCIQTDTSMSPSLKANIFNLNNKASLLFDGVDDYMPFTTRITNIRTVFFIIKHLPSASNFEPVLGDNIGTDFQGDDYPVTNRIFHFSDASSSILNGAIRINQVNITPVVISPRPNNYAIVSLTTTANVAAKQITRDRGIVSRVWKGEYSEIIIYDRALTPAEVSLVENYFINKYGGSVNLGPDISIIQNSGCIPSNTINIQANPNFQSYLWSTNVNDTLNNINVNQYGEYSVITTDIFGINHYDTIKVTPTPKNFNYPLNNAICGNGSITWNTQLDKTVNQFQWQDSSTDSLFVITSPGQYFLTITDTFSCAYISNTVTITQDNFASSVSLGPDISLCSGNSITLTSGASPSLTYMWNNGSTNDSLQINTSGQYSVVVTNTNNCVARDTIIVNISGQAPIANFSTSIGCQNTAVSFTNLSSAVSGNTIIATNWNFGDSASGTFNTSTVNNPFHTFSDTGNYIVSLKVITDANCEQSITKTIHISPKPTVNFSIGNSCQNDNTSFFNLSTSPVGYSITSLNWNFGDPVSGSSNTSNATNPQHLFSNQSNYTIKLVVTNNAGCKDSLINIITVKAQVKADFTYSTPCTNTTTVFQDNSVASSSASSTRSWNFGSTPFSSGLTVPKTYAASGVYAVSLTVTVNSCTSNISKIITIFSPPAPNFTIPAFCLKDTVTAINSSVAQSGIISSYNWKLNNVQFSAIQNPTLSLTNSGSYPVRLTVINSFGCKDSLTKTITVFPLPNVDFTTNPTAYYYINSPVNFIPTIMNASSYLWNVSSVTSSTVQSPSFTFNTEGSYTVTLNLKDQQGCRNSKTKTILVSKPYLDVAILNVTTIKDDDGYMTVKADLANYGTIPVSTFDIQYQISDGGNNKETWTGMLNPSAFFTYTFNSKSASLANSTNNITCVDIKKVNGISDENQTNNNLCSTLSYDEIAVSNPIPNPAEGDITLPVILNKIIEINITIYNSNGQLLYEAVPQKGIEGLNLIILPTSSYSRGAYIIKTVIDDKVFIKKIIKISNK